MSTITTTSQPATSSSFKRLIVRHQLVSFMVLAFAGAWCGWLPLLLARNGLGVLPLTLPTDLFVALAAFAGPTLSTLIMTAVTGGKAGVWQFLRRYIQWRVGMQWYLLILFGFFGVYLLVTSSFLGTTVLSALVQKWSLLFSVFLPSILTVLIFGQLWEEGGWRGFALPRFQARVGALGASLIVGTLQALWHVPALFIAGTIVPGKLVLTVPIFVENVLSLVLVGIAIGVIVTWVYNNTQGSLLVVILFHTVWDATNHLVQQLIPAFFTRASVLALVAYIACALLLIIFTKGRLSFKPSNAVQSGAADRSAVKANT